MMICVVVRLRCEKVSDTEGEREGNKETKERKTRQSETNNILMNNNQNYEEHFIIQILVSISSHFDIVLSIKLCMHSAVVCIERGMWTEHIQWIQT